MTRNRGVETSSPAPLEVGHSLLRVLLSHRSVGTVLRRLDRGAVTCGTPVATESISRQAGVVNVERGENTRRVRSVVCRWSTCARAQVTRRPRAAQSERSELTDGEIESNRLLRVGARRAGTTCRAARRRSLQDRGPGVRTTSIARTSRTSWKRRLRSSWVRAAAFAATAMRVGPRRSRSRHTKNRYQRTAIAWLPTCPRSRRRCAWRARLC